MTSQKKPEVKPDANGTYWVRWAGKQHAFRNKEDAEAYAKAIEESGSSK